MKSFLPENKYTELLDLLKKYRYSMMDIECKVFSKLAGFDDE